MQLSDLFSFIFSPSFWRYFLFSLFVQGALHQKFKITRPICSESSCEQKGGKILAPSQVTFGAVSTTSCSVRAFCTTPLVLRAAFED